MDNFRCSARGQLTADGLLDLYFMQTVGDAGETLRDLRALGYDEKLQPIANGDAAKDASKTDETTSDASNADVSTPEAAKTGAKTEEGGSA